MEILNVGYGGFDYEIMPATYRNAKVLILKQSSMN